jgi:hypothetical protein
VIRRVLKLTSLACCALVAASFVLFARDQLAGASEHQQSQIAVGATTNPGPVPIGTHHAQPRRFIDGAASTLTSPFRSLANSSSAWVTRGLPTIIALVVYGAGLGYLARFSSGLP